MSGDTVKLMGYTSDLGKLSSGIFDSWKQYPDGREKGSNYNILTDQPVKPKKGHQDKWCAGYATGDQPDLKKLKIDNHLLYVPPGVRDPRRPNQCDTWDPPGTKKRRRRYRYITRKPNSENTGLYVKGSEVIRGSPCPEAENVKYASSLKPGREERIKLSCDYPVIDDTLLRKMAGAMEPGEREGPRYNTWHAVADKFCTDPANAYKKIHKNEMTCKAVFKNKDLARSYCATGDKMATDQQNCNQGKLTDSVYDELGNKFCNANPTNPWCACYNVINNNTVCTGAGATNAGCMALIAKRALLASGGQAVGPFNNKPQCQMPSCSGGDTFQPVTGSYMTCDMTYNTCNQNIEQGVAKNSPLNASCNFSKEEAKKADANGASDPKKMSEAEKNKAETEELQGMLDFANESDKADAEEAARAGAAGGTVTKKTSGSSTTMLIIVAVIMLCVCGGIAMVAMS
jgi:hypothetical protein